MSGERGENELSGVCVKMNCHLNCEFSSAKKQMWIRNILRYSKVYQELKIELLFK